MTTDTGHTDPVAGAGWVAPQPLPLPIRTPRLVIRPYVASDARVLFEAVSSSRNALLPWLPWAATDHVDVDRSRLRIAEWIELRRDPSSLNAIPLGIFDRGLGVLLGGTGPHDIRPDTASAELGYWVRPDGRRHGIATEATRHVLSWCLAPGANGGLGLRRVRITCSSANEPSRRIPERLGLRLEAHERDAYFVPTVGLTDRLGFAVLATEWDCHRHQLRADA